MKFFFCQNPKYLTDCNYELTNDEYIELDELAKLMLNPNENFATLKYLWENTEKFRIISGGMNN